MDRTGTWGPFALLLRLEKGRMGDVYLAATRGATGVTKLVVVKRLHEHLAEDADFVAMFLDEARVAARLRHPNVVLTTDAGDVHGAYYIAMEFLEGRTLARLIKKAVEEGVELSLSKHVFLLSEVLAGLGHAHALADYDGRPLNVVHRNVTPHNVFITFEGEVKVIGFGYALARGRAAETREGITKGVVRYMAPEQARGRAVDRRADLFAVGKMLWEAASGEPFWSPAVHDHEVLSRLIRAEKDPKVLARKPLEDPEIDRICKKALAADPDARYQSADEMRADLEAYLAGRGELAEIRKQLREIVRTIYKDQRRIFRGVIRTRVRAAHGGGDLGRADGPASQDAPPEAGTSEAPDAPTALLLGGSGTGTGPLLGESAAIHLFGTAGEPEGEEITSSKSIHPRFGQPGGRLAIAAGLAAVGVILLTAAALALHGARHRAANVAPPPGSALLASASPPASSVRVRLTTSPDSAEVRLDGLRIANPYEVTLTASPEPHALVVSAPGFETQQELLRFDQDVDFSVSLKPSAEAVSSEPRPHATTAHSPKHSTSSAATPDEAPSHAPALRGPTPATSASTPQRRPIDPSNPF